jgi:hypothetical protein
MWSRVIFGAVLCLLGGVWFGQGQGWIKGSFMTGHGFWTVMGAIVVVVGVLLVVSGARKRRPAPE